MLLKRVYIGDLCAICCLIEVIVSDFSLAFLQFHFFQFRFDSFALHANADKSEQAHIHICNPDKSKKCDQITAPTGIKKLIFGNDQENQHDIVAEAVFAGKKIKEFPYQKTFSIFRFIYAEFTWLSKYFFMCNCPGNTGNRQSHYKQINNLLL